MRVREAMSTDVVTAVPDGTAWAAGELMLELDVTGLPVIDPDGRVLGLVTQLDLIDAIRRGLDPRTLTVADIMHPYPVYVQPDSTVDEAAALLAEWGVHRLPVCDEGRLVGIISRGDVLRTLLYAVVPLP